MRNPLRFGSNDRAIPTKIGASTLSGTSAHIPSSLALRFRFMIQRSSLIALTDARHHDPFSLLGLHEGSKGAQLVRVYQPHARGVDIWLDEQWVPMADMGEGVFEFEGTGVPRPYQLRIQPVRGDPYLQWDPYCFAPMLSDHDLYLFSQGKLNQAWRMLGAHALCVDGVDGVRFAVWAPNAERVSVVGDFNAWDGRRHPMRSRGSSGVWELFIPGLNPGDQYKFEIRQRGTGMILTKTDPYAQAFEMRPGTAARVIKPIQHAWQDSAWIEQRSTDDWLTRPMSIYEVHLGSWRRAADGRFLNYRELADQLVEYLKPLDFTHVELLPVTEHPLDDSWGYQCTGFFAATSRFGSLEDFRYFVDHCHQNGLGVLLDWVPGHFPRDDFALARFDGTPLYEHEDPRRGEHKEWGTLIFNYGRNEVRNFLLASALYWIEEFHIDGLRVDAVASMLYLDYSRKEGEWLPNQYGGRENIDAIEFLRELNSLVHGLHPGVTVIAEESTAWPQVTRPAYVGGLGFSMKWNMGWMHDTLEYISKDPIHRPYHHDHLTFGMLYAFTENFVLPFSHDEVVHGKGSMIDKMPGDRWQKFANLRLLLLFQFTYPGKKLLFMGSEFAQWAEWNFAAALDWPLLEFDTHRGVHRLTGDLNRLYRGEPTLHRHDFDGSGFEWIDCHDVSQSVISYQRKSFDQAVVVVLNFTPVLRHRYRLGVPHPGHYQVLLNSDSDYYGGSNAGPMAVDAEATPWMGLGYSIVLDLPPLAGVVLKRVR
jgi:1,4-alpha-glucan branching enzyme